MLFRRPVRSAIPVRMTTTTIASAKFRLSILREVNTMKVKQAAVMERRYRACCDLPVLAQPMAGITVFEKMKIMFKKTQDDMAEDATELLEAGAGIIGG